MRARWRICKSGGLWAAVPPCTAGCESAHRPLEWLAYDDGAPRFHSWQSAMDFVASEVSA